MITGVDVQLTVVGVESIELLELGLVETEEKAAICTASCLFRSLLFKSSSIAVNDC